MKKLSRILLARIPRLSVRHYCLFLLPLIAVLCAQRCTIEYCLELVDSSAARVQMHNKLHRYEAWVGKLPQDNPNRKQALAALADLTWLARTHWASEFGQITQMSEISNQLNSLIPEEIVQQEIANR